MKRAEATFTIPDEVMMSKILIIRNKKVMIDMDLAELYGVQTKRLNEQVKRNIERFPEDFMFQLTGEEKQQQISDHSYLNKLKFSSSLPLAFTEHGAVMLASVLNSERAIGVNIRIVRIFTQIREMFLTNKDILLKLERLENNAVKNNIAIAEIFKALKKLMQEPDLPRERVGFRKD